MGESIPDGTAEPAPAEVSATPSPQERAKSAMVGMISTIEDNFVTEAERRLPYQIMELYLGQEGQLVFPERGSEHGELHVVHYERFRFGEGEEAVTETTMKVHTPPELGQIGHDFEYTYVVGRENATVQSDASQNQPMPINRDGDAKYLEWVQGNLNNGVQQLMGGFGAAGAGVDDV